MDGPYFLDLRKNRAIISIIPTGKEIIAMESIANPWLRPSTVFFAFNQTYVAQEKNNILPVSRM
jgi:hypothetical protein